MDLEYFVNLSKIMFEGLAVTLKLFGLTLLFAVPLGFIIAIAKMSKKKWISKPINFYILIVRGTPLMLQLMFVYFGPYYLFGLNYDRFTAAVIAFVLNYAAYFAEIFRGGISSMPKGQYEASASLGFTKAQNFFHIILPQVIKRIIPASSNEVITLVKDTALAQVIAVAELFTLAQKQTSAQFSVVPLIVAGVFYLALNSILSLIFHKIEKKLNYYQ